LLFHDAPVRALALSPDGKNLLSGSDDKTARFWELPTPVEGTPERLKPWLECLVGRELDALGQVHLLDSDAKQQRQERLRQLGGPPVR
jgi:WD40 repeat protein